MNPASHTLKLSNQRGSYFLFSCKLSQLNITFCLNNPNLPFQRHKGFTERSKGSSFGVSESHKELIDWELEVLVLFNE